MEKKDFELLKDSLSPSFCLAKFHTATLRLFGGDVSTGCFHNPFTPVGKDLNTFFNPPERRAQQAQMLAGEKPSGCSYCWNIEAQGLPSDRTFFSLNVKTPQPIEFYRNAASVAKPKYLEVSFQRTCNFACSYCSPEFSTSWINDIRVNGEYKLNTLSHYNNIPTTNHPSEEIIKLFWAWFDDVVDELETIRITGGEPLLHQELFDVLDVAVNRNPRIEVVVNSNLVNSGPIIDRFISNIKRFENSIVYTSNEAIGEVSEFIRDGMIYDEWISNIKKVAPHVKFVGVMATPSAVSLQSFHQMISEVFKLRSEGFKVIFSVNLVRRPEFQSLDSLTLSEKKHYLEIYSKVLSDSADLFRGKEKDGVERLIAELKKPPTELQSQRRADLISFFEQYTIRRNKKTNFVFTI